jgi:hypothetical protein
MMCGIPMLLMLRLDRVLTLLMLRLDRVLTLLLMRLDGVLMLLLMRHDRALMLHFRSKLKGYIMPMLMLKGVFLPLLLLMPQEGISHVLRLERAYKLLLIRLKK